MPFYQGLHWQLSCNELHEYTKSRTQTSQLGLHLISCMRVHPLMLPKGARLPSPQAVSLLTRVANINIKDLTLIEGAIP